MRNNRGLKVKAKGSRLAALTVVALLLLILPVSHALGAKSVDDFNTGQPQIEQNTLGTTDSYLNVGGNTVGGWRGMWIENTGGPGGVRSLVVAIPGFYSYSQDTLTFGKGKIIWSGGASEGLLALNEDFSAYDTFVLRLVSADFGVTIEIQVFTGGGIQSNFSVSVPPATTDTEYSFPFSSFSGTPDWADVEEVRMFWDSSAVDNLDLSLDWLELQGPPDLECEKVFSPDTGLYPGAETTATVTVTNTGGDDTTVTITDTLAAGLSYDPGSSKWNGSDIPDPSGGTGPVLTWSDPSMTVASEGGTGTLTYDVIVDDIDPLEELCNFVEVQSVEYSQVTTTCFDCVEGAPPPELECDKLFSPDAGVVPTDEVTATVTISNLGLFETTVDINDTLASGLSYKLGTSTWNGGAISDPSGGTGPNLTWSSPTLTVPAGESRTLEYVVVVDAILPLEELCNLVEVQSVEYSQVSTTCFDCVEGAPPPELDCDKIFSPDTGLVPSGETTATVTISNTGDWETTVTIYDTLQTGLSYKLGSSKWNTVAIGNPSGGTGPNLTWSSPTLTIPAGGSGTLEYVVVVDDIQPLGELCNDVVVEWDDDTSVNTTCFDCVEGAPPPDLNCDKVFIPDTPVVPGDIRGVQVTIGNTGVFSTNVNIEDQLPDGFSYVANSSSWDGGVGPEPVISGGGLTLTWSNLGPLAGGGSGVLTYQIQVDAINPGQTKCNNVTVTSVEFPSIDTNCSDCLTGVTVELECDKFFDVYTVFPGDNVLVTVEVINATVIPVPVSISDTLDSGLQYVPGTSERDGVPIPDPTIVAQNLTWNNVGTVPANGTMALTYQVNVVAISLGGVLCNSVVVYDPSLTTVYADCIDCVRALGIPPDVCPTCVPTMSQWGMILFPLLLGAMGIWSIRRRKRK